MNPDELKQRALEHDGPTEANPAVEHGGPTEEPKTSELKQTATEHSGPTEELKPDKLKQGAAECGGPTEESKPDKLKQLNYLLSLGGGDAYEPFDYVYRPSVYDSAEESDM